MAAGEQTRHEWLDGMPEIGVLRDVARACDEPIRIRGGVPRNLLGRATKRQTWVTPPRHLVDLVDPLSDIDIVVSRADKIPFVLGLIFRRIALAGFIRWEGKTADQVSYFEQCGAMTNLDGVEIVITPEAAHLRVTTGAMRDLEERRLRWRIPPSRERLPRDTADADAILFALRVERFAVEFGLEVDEVLTTPVERHDRREQRISPLDVMRIEFAALDILLTAPASTDATRGLRRVREIVPGWIRRKSPVLSHLEDVALDEPLRVIAWPRLGAQPPRVRLEANVHQNAALVNEPSLLPWTAIRLPRFGQGGCCPPDDFTLGPLVVAWRGVPLLHERTGVVALAPPADPYDAPSRTVFAVPGVITSGPGVVQRFDWGFARYIAGDGRLVYFGARDVLTPESSS